VSFTATVTGNSPTGTVQFYVDGSAFGSAVTLSGGTATSSNTTSLSVGTHTVTATYSGDSANLGSSGTLSGGQVVGQASAGTVVTSSGSPSIYGQGVTFTATINGAYGQIKGAGKTKVNPETVTGTVAWSSNTGCGTTAVTSGNPGTATCTTSILAVGSDTVTGTYSGDANHTGSAGSIAQTVSQAATAVSVSVSPNNEDYGLDSPATVTAVLSWSGSGTAPTASAVSITGNGNGTYGATSCGAATANTITCTASYTPSTADGPGSYTETATFAGDTNYTSSSNSASFTINTASASTVVTSSGSPTVYGQSVTFTATINGENGNVKGRRELEHGLRYDQRDFGQSGNGDLYDLDSGAGDGFGLRDVLG
jgi:hypothetical protein